MSRDVVENPRISKRSDGLSRYLKDLGVRRFQALAERSGFSSSKLEALRDDLNAPVRYVDAVRLIAHSKGGIRMDDFDSREMSDRGRFDNPLGRKIALALADGTTIGSILSANGMTHVELGRWLTENTKWHKSTRRRIIKAFSRNGVEITEEDFEEQKVDRLRAQYEEARDHLERRRGGEGK